MSDWISVKDRLPLHGNWVLTCNEGYYGGHLCWYDRDNIFYIEGRGKYSKIWMNKDKDKPTHWMYFPNPVGINDASPMIYEDEK